jgi:predicted O-methyltransferase YrrM
MELAAVTERVRDVPWMSPEQGAEIYRHIRETTPDRVLELGTANGASAAYMAAALEENGKGHLVTFDRSSAGFEPAPLLRDLGLDALVTFVRRDDSSYNWYLKELLEEQSDAAGNCKPIFDFCYLDGAHNWTIDGLAVVLVEKLLKPGSWLLLDDLEWSYASSPSGAAPPFPLSSSELREPHMRAVFDLIVRQHPSFTQFRVQDANWGWAAKSPNAPRRYDVTSTRSTAGLVAMAGWKLARIASSKARRGKKPSHADGEEQSPAR